MAIVGVLIGLTSIAAVSTQPTSQSGSRPITFLKNWGLINTEARSHISAIDAWKVTRGSKKIVVAVIDTGIDPTHPDLKDNLWCDPEIKDHCRFGWNFVNDHENPLDDHGHGTHVAGIIGAKTDARSGVSGVAPEVRIMAIKYYSDANPGSVNLRNTIKAINYAVDHGANIINYSGGGPEFSEDEYLALRRAESKGILIVAASGNEHQNTDFPQNNYYPAAYHLPNAISVMSLDIYNNPLLSANWGKHRVDLGAPGENIFSTLPGKRYGYMSGTSQATPFVTGTAVLLWASYPNLTALQVKEAILAGVDRFPQLADKNVTGGRLNAYGALLAAKRISKGLQ